MALRLLSALSVAAFLGAVSAQNCVDDCYLMYIPQTGCPGSSDPNAPVTPAYLQCVCQTYDSGALANYLSCVSASCNQPGVLEFFQGQCAAYPETTTTSTTTTSTTTTTTSTSTSTSSTPTPTGPSWSYVGCITETSSPRALSAADLEVDSMTVELCQQYCYGFLYAGLEYNRECYCDNTIGSGSTSAPESDCSDPCMGNSAETCGGASRISLYQQNSFTPPTGPVAVQAYNGWTYAGCYSDNVGGRTLPNRLNLPERTTVEYCLDACHAAGYTIAGLEYSGECYCDDSFNYGGAPIAEASCDMVCDGDTYELCGGPNALSTYMYTGTMKRRTFDAVPRNFVKRDSYFDNSGVEHDD